MQGDAFVLASLNLKADSVTLLNISNSRQSLSGYQLKTHTGLVVRHADYVVNMTLLTPLIFLFCDVFSVSSLFLFSILPSLPT